jgi:hypothetical protein
MGSLDVLIIVVMSVFSTLLSESISWVRGTLVCDRTLRVHAAVHLPAACIQGDVGTCVGSQAGTGRGSALPPIADREVRALAPLPHPALSPGNRLKAELKEVQTRLGGQSSILSTVFIMITM